MVTTKERTAVVKEEDIATLDNFADKKLQEATELSEVMAVDPPLVQRGGIYLISGLLTVTLSLLYFGKVPVWAKAKGNIIPEGESIPVQALQRGVVRSVLAQVGERLPKNAPLLTLDTSQSNANLSQLQGQLNLQQKRLQGLQQDRTQVETILAAPETFLAQEQTVNFHDSNLLQTVYSLRRAKTELTQARAALDKDLADQKEQLRQEIELSRQRLTLLYQQKELGIANLKKDETNLVARKQLLAETRQLSEKRLLSQLEIGRQNIALMEKYKELALLDLQQDELNLQGKNKRLEESRQLAEEGFLSQLDLEAEEERYPSAERGLSESHKQVEQQEIEIANERSRLREIELELLRLKEDRESVRQAEAALEESRQQLKQQKLDIGNEELRLAELEVQLGAAAVQPSQQYDTARTNYNQSLDNLKQSLVTMEEEMKTVAAEIANQIESSFCNTNTLP